MEHTVEAVMTSEVVTAQPSTPFQELVRLLEQCHISALPVVDDSGRLVGIVSGADLLIKEGYPHGATDASPVDAARYRKRLDKAAGTRAAELMAAPVSTVPLGTLIADAVRLMLRLDVKRLPVVDARGGLAGIVARSDLLKVFLRPDPAVRCRRPGAHRFPASHLTASDRASWGWPSCTLPSPPCSSPYWQGPPRPPGRSAQY